MWDIKPTSEEMMDASVINFDDWEQVLKARATGIVITLIGKSSSKFRYLLREID